MAEIMTVEEVADYLRVTEKTIYRLLKQGKIPSAKVGRQWRFQKSSIDEWLQQNSVRKKAVILVVDDREIIQVLLRESLEELGHRVVVAGTSGRCCGTDSEANGQGAEEGCGPGPHQQG